MVALYWLPEIARWRERLRALGEAGDGVWDEAVALAGARLDAVATNALDTMRRRVLPEPPRTLSDKPVRLAVLGSSTLAHLLPAIRVAGLRRRLWVETYENDYGQYWQELADPGSALYRFKPTAILLALDARHLAAGIGAAASAAEIEAALDAASERIRACWRLARDNFACAVIHQLALPVHAPLVGGNEHRLAGSRAQFVARLNARLRAMADTEGVDLLALDARAARDGIAAWHNPELWHRAKQDVSPAAAPMYGELVMRLVGAHRGRSYKALVLDLDNTIWGGVVGDDGVEGLVLGQGSALGEAFVEFQDYARELSRRGVILAACSKNDEANALEPFDRHPEMVLRRGDIASFVANWADKPSNIRAIAQELNIGLDALVFVDDNPFERDLVRRELPMVAVPEISDDPTSYPQTLADAGYFEAVAITEEDRARSGQYQSNRERDALKASATDLGSYLRGLEMRLTWRRFDRVGLSRIVQLINKTNQFNLTTRRYSEGDVLAVMADKDAFGVQLRLIDRFGDNGIIAIVIGRLDADSDRGADLVIDTWLMSCRVLGRQVEPTTLNLVAALGAGLGARRLVGEYIPTAKNGMVKNHYTKLGFTPCGEGPDGATGHVLDLAGFRPRDTFVTVEEEEGE
ncbi:MAG TPA: HAD-IIIC family phosphatase [Stellaceae bacterium]|nr:HAD-IIIC family phosphatase [Stellaceae bacterium]